MADRLFVQVDVAFGRNRKVRQAGMLGWVVFLQLVATHRINPAEGWISAGEASPDAILLGLAAFAGEIDEERIDGALQALAAAGMIRRDAAGNVFVEGWEDWFGPLTSTERSRRHRARMQERDAMQRDATAGDGRERSAADATLPSPLVSSRSPHAAARKSVSQSDVAAPSKGDPPTPPYVPPEDRDLALEEMRNGR